MNIFQFGGSVGARVWEIMSERKKEAPRAEALLKKLEAQFGGRMPEEARRKVIVSYSIYQPMIIDAFTALRGRKATLEEKERLVQYFICSGAFDDFVDRNELSPEDLDTISFAPENFQPRRIEEKMFLHCHLALRNFVRHRAAYDQAARGLFRAQVDSGKQSRPEPMSAEELLRITLEKGGYAVLLCHFYLDHDASEAERSCWYRIGGIIQLTNDLFDIWKDIQAGVQTLPNTMTDAHAFHAFLSAEVREMMEIIGTLPVPKSRKRAFLLNMMAICSFSDMAVARLRRIQGAAPQLPDLKTLPRKALIVDMEKPANIWHCMRYTFQQCRDGQRLFSSTKPIPA
ncbi:class 1 isoprenoid biosynthesis enzyme [Chitinophaga caseinilytica]|uniref:class 1 isoprenoid biosynthesis enzyme n=1 Tax=Chitinophaga caseinilytica TaxID=2267521 RepID=UPI003C2E31F0